MNDPTLDLVGNWVRVLSLRTRLLAWYDRHRRELPWRRDRDPYRVLVSEFMLQQTRVEVVVPYFERWMARWPTLSALAAAELDEVLAAWSGLGYYRRAWNLHALAKKVVAERGGELPRTAKELRELPGIGPYTAAAVASIAFDEPVAVVDGNVERVLVRVLCDQRSPDAARRRTVEEAARRLVTAMVGQDPAAVAPPEGLRPADWNQAMMELGATICLPGEPKCLLCPWAKTCIGHRAGLAADLPKRRTRTPTVDVTLHAAVVRDGERFLLVRRPEASLLSALWELPTVRSEETLASLAARIADTVGHAVQVPPAPSRTFGHTITHHRITVYVHEVVLDGGAVREPGGDVAWVTPRELANFGVSSMTRKALGGTNGRRRPRGGAATMHP